MSPADALPQPTPPTERPSSAAPSHAELARLEAEADATLRQIDAAARATDEKAELVRRVAEDLAASDCPIAPEELDVIERARQAAVPHFDPGHFVAERTALRVRAMQAEIDLLRSMLQAARAHRKDLDGIGDQLLDDEARLTDIAARARMAREAPMQPTAATAPGSGTDYAERRQFERKQLQVAVDFQSDHNFFTGLTNDISEGGLFVATINLLPIGTPVSLRFTLPSGYSLEARGRVRWVREWNDRTPDVYPGMGVQFAHIGDDTRAAIESFINQREPDFFAD